MKRNVHPIMAAALFTGWFILFALMQLLSFAWVGQNELLFCVLTIGLFLLQLPAILFFIAKNASWNVAVFTATYGIALIVKDITLILVIIRPNWHGPLALVFTCLFCDLTALLLCRRYHRKGVQEESKQGNKE